MRAAFYLRVSTAGQDVENQRRELLAVAGQRGWDIVAEFADEGISGSKGRADRPGLDKALNAAARGECDILMAWAVDRLGRSLPDLLATMQHLQAVNVALYIHKQAVDTTTPSGRAMFGMLGVFAEFEKSMNKERIHAGIARAKAAGRRAGPKGIQETDPARYADVCARLSRGETYSHVARKTKTGVATVMRIQREINAQKALQPNEVEA